MPLEVDRRSPLALQIVVGRRRVRVMADAMVLGRLDELIFATSALRGKDVGLQMVVDDCVKLPTIQRHVAQVGLHVREQDDVGTINAA